MRWSHTHLWQLRIGRDVSAMEVPNEEWRISAHIELLSQVHQRLEEEFSYTLAVKISGHFIWMRWKPARDPGIPLKGPSIDSLTLILTSRKVTKAQKVPRTNREELNCQPSQQGLQEQLSLKQVPTGTIIPLLSPHPLNLQAQVGAKSDSPLT